MTLLKLRLPAALAALLLFTACGDDGDGGSGDAPQPSPTPTPMASEIPTPSPTPMPDLDTWENFAQEFFATYCNECHDGAPRDYQTIGDVMRDEMPIRCGVSPVAEAGCGAWPPPGQFPVGAGPKPDDATRRRLIDWLDAGLPE